MEKETETEDKRKHLAIWSLFSFFDQHGIHNRERSGVWRNTEARGERRDMRHEKRSEEPLCILTLY